MHTITLEGRGNLGEWRDAARALLQRGVRPRDVDWRTVDEAESLFPDAVDDSLPAAPEGPPLSVPADFVKLAGAVVCHSDPGRFGLLYRLLFRLARDRNILSMAADADVVAARLMAKSVGRDYHKMTAFVRFKEVTLPPGEAGRRRFVAWFEPDHYIVERVAPFFQRRFNDMDWLIATPKGSASWDGETLRVTSEPAVKPDLRDEADDLWRTYYASIFNPARLKVKAMTAEMPKKYWKNLPEADLIPGLIANAERSVMEMASKAASEPQPFHHRLQAAAALQPGPQPPPAGTIEALKEEVRHCTRCPLHCKATQTVFGEGNPAADIMVVGEQPGDQEDLAGRPFVGPAGRVFDEVIRDAGLDRSSLYVTNAVKHFKYEPRGKRRIHQKPSKREVEQCRWWLGREIALVKPKLVVAMGATAYFALTDDRRRLADVRGRPMPMEGGRSLFVTVHPSYLLRIPDPDLKAKELLRFREDFESVQGLAAGFA